MKIDVSKWKEFSIGNVFDVINGKGITEEECQFNTGDLPAIQGGASNNGIIAKIDKEYCLEKKYIIINPPCLTVARVGSSGVVNCQGETCVIGDKAKALVIKHYNADISIYLFCQAILNQLKYKYSYGRGVSTQTYKEEKIKLPVVCNDDGTPIIDPDKKYSPDGWIPDWDWMEMYIKSLKSRELTTKNAANKGKMSIDPKEWVEFNIGDVFEIINGKGITEEECEFNPGKIPAIQGGATNNGILNFIDQEYCIEKKYNIVSAPCLTVARVGTSGVVNCQGNDCVVGDKAKALLIKKENASIAVYLFCQAILNQLVYKYSYGRGVATEKYKKEKIKLPVAHNTDGTLYIDPEKKYSKDGYVPDWDFMEKYIKALPYGDRI